MADEMLERVKQPMLIEMKIDQLKDTYGLDPALLEEFTVRYPLMNVKTNEIAIFKVKDEKEIATVKLAIEKRATVVQKQFEFYLPDQYENAKNYKIITNGKYVLFLISESADELGKAFSTFFKTS
ncbi:hypothetical protein CIG75_00765 [Tumebacillus algifaecis]|uniref:DUF4358 domain-containing protein n=2 Tax=Tumebacillus algifaecis TaxID=1214604 RepID=A0A223D6M4_9BACL|nr:hypothetical protein CIG75_00765 [Tumebacillus algifaecis]